MLALTIHESAVRCKAAFKKSVVLSVNCECNKIKDVQSLTVCCETRAV